VSKSCTVFYVVGNNMGMESRYTFLSLEESLLLFLVGKRIIACTNVILTDRS
jgi:hypothetical protein